MNYFTGFNGFHQFGLTHARRVLEPTELDLNNILVEPNDSLRNGIISQIGNSFCYVVFVIGDVELVFSGFITKKPDTVRKMKMSWKIKQIATGENFTLVLLENGDLIKINIHTMTSEKMNFLKTENKLRKRNIFGEIQTNGFPVDEDSIEHISCGSIFSVAVTRNNNVYNIPTKIFEFPKDERITQLASGFEHALALNANGDVYSWGEGLRGQLGDDSMKMRLVPAKVEPLAGIKIVSISAGGWHSAAVSSFGDVYLWGFNSHGQLGIRLYKNSSNSENLIKNPSVYSIPQLVDLVCSCKKQETQQTTEAASADTESESTSQSKPEEEPSTISDSTEKIEDTKETTDSGMPLAENTNADSKETTDSEMPLAESSSTENRENIEENMENTSKDSNIQDAQSSKESQSNCNVIKAFCGSRHTIVQMECGKLFSVGSNENGQLGLAIKDNVCDQFKEITSISNKKVSCGAWNTIFQNL